MIKAGWICHEEMDWLTFPNMWSPSLLERQKVKQDWGGYSQAPQLQKHLQGLVFYCKDNAWGYRFQGFSFFLFLRHIEFCTILPPFYVLVFWPWGKIPSCLGIDPHLCIGGWSLNRWTTKKVSQLQFFRVFIFMRVVLVYDKKPLHIYCHKIIVSMGHLSITSPLFLLPSLHWAVCPLVLLWMVWDMMNEGPGHSREARGGSDQ